MKMKKKTTIFGILASSFLLAVTVYAGTGSSFMKTKTFHGTTPDYICGGMNNCVTVDFSNKVKGGDDDGDQIWLEQTIYMKDGKREPGGVGTWVDQGKSAGLAIINASLKDITSIKDVFEVAGVDGKARPICAIEQDPAKPGIIRFGVVKLGKNQYTCMRMS